MKRYWPLYLALFCWLLVLIVPATRHNIGAGLNNWTAYADLIMYDYSQIDSSEANYAVPPPRVPMEMTHRAKQLNERFPGDKRAQLFAAIEDCDSGHCNALARRYPNDVFIISLQLGSSLPLLRHSRQDGPITNYNYPEDVDYASPPEDWERFVALARRGSRLEPQNCFFDIMLLNGLFVLRRDDEARRVLKAAARKTIYDPHQREALLNAEQVLHFVYDMPPPPQELNIMAKRLRHSRAYNLRDVSRWTMDLAVSDRLKGRHESAIATTLDLIRLCRTVRVSGISIADSKAGFEGEENALTNMAPINRDGSNTQPFQLEQVALPVAQYKQYSRSLYSYAKALHRDDIAAMAVSEWNELHGSMWIYQQAEQRFVVVAF